MKKIVSMALLGMLLILHSVPGYAWGFGSRGSYSFVPKGTPAYQSGLSALASGLSGKGRNCYGKVLPTATGLIINYITNKIFSLVVEDPTFGGNFWNVDLETCKITNEKDRLFYALWGFGFD